jgi:hypothetical protein
VSLLEAKSAAEPAYPRDFLLRSMRDRSNRFEEYTRQGTAAAIQSLKLQSYDI